MTLSDDSAVRAACDTFWDIAIQSQGNFGSLWLPMWPRSTTWAEYATHIGKKMMTDKEYAQDAKVGTKDNGGIPVTRGAVGGFRDLCVLTRNPTCRVRRGL